MAHLDTPAGADHGKAIDRGNFLRKAGLGAAGVALGGAIPSLINPRSAQAALSFAGKTLNVSYWGNITPQQDLLAVFNGFAKQNGLTVKYNPQPVAFGDTVQKLTTYLSSGYTGLDVLWLDDFMTASFGTAGWLDPLDSVIPHEAVAAVPAATIKLSTYNGHLVRVPANGGDVVFFYRMDLFKKAGLSVPRTWQDVVTAGQKLTKNGVYGLGFAGKNGNTQLFNELCYWMGQAGASPLNLKTAGARATLKFLYDALHTHKIMPPDTVTADYTALQTSFQNGKIAMWPTWDGILGSLLPNAKGGNTKFPTYGKVNIAVPPKGPVKNSTITASWGWAISKFSPNKDMAAKFIQYASSPQNEVTLALTGSTPARVALYSNSKVQSVIPQAKYDAIYAKEVPVGSRPITAQAQRVSDALETVINEYLNKQLSLDAAITQGQQRIDQILQNS